jgi:hypothetical protein
MRRRREAVEHPFGTIKARMGATHFLMKRLRNVAAEMALHALTYNLTRVMNIVGEPSGLQPSAPPEGRKVRPKAQYRVAIPTLADHWTIRSENISRLQGLATTAACRPIPLHTTKTRTRQSRARRGELWYPPSNASWSRMLRGP